MEDKSRKHVSRVGITVVGAIILGLLLLWRNLTVSPSFSTIRPQKTPSVVNEEWMKHNFHPEAPSSNIDRKMTPNNNRNYLSYQDQHSLWLAMKKERDAVFAEAKISKENLTQNAKLFKMYPPIFTCPYSVLRLGSWFGGKWVCGLEELYGNDQQEKRNCVVYSIGIDGDATFDSAVIGLTNCTVFGYDYSVDYVRTLSNNPRMKFQKIGLATHETKKLNYKFTTLKAMMEKNGHTWIDILKLDAEGCEFDGLNMAMDDFQDEEVLPIGQLLVEVHVDKKYKPLIHTTVIPWFDRLESKGLRAFHAEANSFDPQSTFEYAFLNVNAKPFRNSTLSFFNNGWSRMWDYKTLATTTTTTKAP